MMRSLFSGISGLKSHQTKMDVIGNNISNVNTTGFKSSRVVFADMLSQQLSGSSAPKGNVGGTNEKAIGLGTGVGAIDLLFTDGSVQSTGKNTDLALSGSGLFIVKQGSETYYTRNGDFSFDADGNYVMSGNGMYVQGWTEKLDKNGNRITEDSLDKEVASINTNGDAGIINIQAGKSMAPAKTTKANYTGNVNANSNGAITTTITLYDDQGIAYSVPLVFERAASYASSTTSGVAATSMLGNKWVVGFPTHEDTTNPSYTTTTATSYSSLTTVYNIQNDAGQYVGTCTLTSLATLIFNNDGSFNTVTSDPPATAAATTLTGVPSFDVTLTVSNPPLSLVVPGSTMPSTSYASVNTSVDINLGSLTQYANESTLYGDTNGWASGVLKSVSFDSSGLITGVYTNGVRQYEGQVAIAQFTNPSGLTKAGNSLYQASDNSGSANVKTATALGVTITASALELSNVDIATEFAEMITTQRGFQSNSKIVTVGDEMLETVINMKR